MYRKLHRRVTPSNTPKLSPMYPTALKSTILTASFITPSPNKIEFNLGYFYSFTTLIAATVSVALKTLANIKHSLVVST